MDKTARDVGLKEFCKIIDRSPAAVTSIFQRGVFPNRSNVLAPEGKRRRYDGIDVLAMTTASLLNECYKIPLATAAHHIDFSNIINSFFYKESEETHRDDLLLVIRYSWDTGGVFSRVIGGSNALWNHQALAEYFHEDDNLSFCALSMRHAYKRSQERANAAGYSLHERSLTPIKKTEWKRVPESD